MGKRVEVRVTWGKKMGRKIEVPRGKREYVGAMRGPKHGFIYKNVEAFFEAVIRLVLSIPKFLGRQ